VTDTAAHLVRDGRFILVIDLLVVASHAGMTDILAETVGPTVRSWSCVPPRSRTLVDFGGAAHLINESCCIFVIGVLVEASHAGVTVIPAAAVGPAVGLDSHVDSRQRHSCVFRGAAHLIEDGCCILVIGVLVETSHTGVISILADTVGPTVAARRRLGSSSSVGRSPFRVSLDYFSGAAHLISKGCCILVICVLILATHAGVTAIPAAAMGPTVSATTRRSSTFLHFDIHACRFVSLLKYSRWKCMSDRCRFQVTGFGMPRPGDREWFGTQSPLFQSGTPRGCLSNQRRVQIAVSIFSRKNEWGQL
jgi:hypothetical protein